MAALTDKQVWASPKLIITIEIGVRGMGLSRVQGHLIILYNGLECQVFPFGCWPFLGYVTFSWSAALSGPT